MPCCRLTSNIDTRILQETRILHEFKLSGCETSTLRIWLRFESNYNIFFDLAQEVTERLRKKIENHTAKSISLPQVGLNRHLETTA